LRAAEEELSPSNREYLPKMGLLARLLGLGDGRLKPELRAALEAEGPVLIEEGLRGSLRYHRFRAPGRYSHGKITAERIGLGISEERLVAYCRSGRAKLLDRPFSNPNLEAVEIEAVGDRLDLLVDYDRLEVPKVSGRIRIRVRTPKAALIATELSSRIGR
jgi:hypothetical protein